MLQSTPAAPSVQAKAPPRNPGIQEGSTSMLVLGIESSCDETAAAIVENGRTIVSNVISNSVAAARLLPQMMCSAPLTYLLP